MYVNEHSYQLKIIVKQYSLIFINSSRHLIFPCTHSSKILLLSK